MFHEQLGLTVTEFSALAPGARAAAAREALVDLQGILQPVEAVADRDGPRATVELAGGLFEHVARALGHSGRAARSLAQRVVTDGLLRAECNHDQNVYMGSLYTRTLTRAVPDVAFQPTSAAEVTAALEFAREGRVPITLRGAASTAMGGAVPSDAGIVLDLTRLNSIEVDAAARRVAIGAGVRMRSLHAELRRHGLALPVYPSNLGGTFAGWFATGGIGLNAYGRGRAIDVLEALEVALPSGERVRIAREGLWSIAADGTRKPEDLGAWCRERGIEVLTLETFAHTEGQFGAIVALELRLEPLPEVPGFLLGFARWEDAHAAIRWIAESRDVGRPADLKLMSSDHVHHARSVWAEEDGKTWHRHAGALATDADLPWRTVLPASQLGAPGVTGVTGAAADGHLPAYLFVSFLSRAEGEAFARALADCPGAPAVLDAEGARFARERFRPQQTKRLGPGFLAAEILMPASRVESFLPAAAALARAGDLELETETYYLADGTALVIAGYLTDHRRGHFHADLLLAPALLDLARRRFEGRAYVLGRWQANQLEHREGARGATRLRELKAALDPRRIVNRGAFFDMGLRGPLGFVAAHTITPAISTWRLLLERLPAVLGGLRWTMGRLLSGPAAGRGFSTAERPPTPGATPSGEGATGRAISCVNCGECNSVCPIFHAAGIRLPQMLTHRGEALHASVALGTGGERLLDLCMRCGNCEEVCQAGIPHLPLYEAMQAAADRGSPPDDERRGRHVLLLEHLRSATAYTADFLQLQPGGYIVRAPAALTGSTRFVLFRAENDQGPSATCIHCAACVDVCPTGANKEYEGPDPRWITTDVDRCIGCGTCVEVCPANARNGGRTLRVMEAPTAAWLKALHEFSTTPAEEATR